MSALPLVYVVTATAVQDTFQWVYTSRDEAQKLVDLGIELGGDVSWESYPYALDMRAADALAEFKLCTEED